MTGGLTRHTRPHTHPSTHTHTLTPNQHGNTSGSGKKRKKRFRRKTKRTCLFQYSYLKATSNHAKAGHWVLEIFSPGGDVSGFAVVSLHCLFPDYLRDAHRVRGKWDSGTGQSCSNKPGCVCQRCERQDHARASRPTGQGGGQASVGKAPVPLILEQVHRARLDPLVRIVGAPAHAGRQKMQRSSPQD